MTDQPQKRSFVALLASALAHPAVVGVALALVTLIVFWPAPHFDFVTLDDPDYVSANPHVQRGLSWEGVVWAFAVGYAHNWHPLTWLSHMLDAQVFGPGPAGPHLVNILFHIANALLLFVLLRTWTGAHWPSAFVAGLFALHPLHTESVAWISERKDVLSTLFWLLTLWAYGRWSTQSIRDGTAEGQWWQPLRSWWYWVVFVFFALGLMSKPMLVTLPLVLLLLDYWPLARVSALVPGSRSPGRVLFELVREKLPFFGLSLVSCVLTLVAQKKAVQSFTYFPLATRVENAFVSYARYLGKLFWPVDLAIPYPPHPGHWPPALAIFSIVLVSALCVGAVWLGSKRPFVFTGWFWFLGTLVPVIGLVQVGIQSMADRYTYVPFIGVFILFAWGTGAALAQWRFPKLVSTALAVILLGVCAARTHHQLAYWQNSETLFRHSIAVFPNDGLAHYSLGFYLFEKGRVEEAIPHYRRALEINPRSADLLSDLGAALDQLGYASEALEKLTAALQLDPNNWTAHYRLGNVLVKRGDNHQAIAHFRVAVREHPDSIEARNNLAVALFKENASDEAIEQFQAIVRLQPANASAHFNLANAVAAQHHWPEAVEQYGEAVRLRPDAPEMRFGLARAMAQMGRREEARAQLAKALELRPDYPPARQLMEALRPVGKE